MLFIFFNQVLTLQQNGNNSPTKRSVWNTQNLIMAHVDQKHIWLRNESCRRQIEDLIVTQVDHHQCQSVMERILIDGVDLKSTN
jgi:hypothetical protein